MSVFSNIASINLSSFDILYYDVNTVHNVMAYLGLSVHNDRSVDIHRTLHLARQPRIFVYFSSVNLSIHLNKYRCRHLNRTLLCGYCYYYYPVVIIANLIEKLSWTEK